MVALEIQDQREGLEGIRALDTNLRPYAGHDGEIAE